MPFFGKVCFDGLFFTANTSFRAFDTQLLCADGIYLFGGTKMTYIGIDFGDRRIGVARSDGVLASAVGTVWITGMNDAVAKISEKIKELNADVVVIGLPKNMDSSEGFRAERTRRFGEAIKEETGIEPVYYDERLTTSQAYVYMNEGNMKSRKRRGVIDTMSAEIILQDYLDSLPKK